MGNSSQKRNARGSLDAESSHKRLRIGQQMGHARPPGQSAGDQFFSIPELVTEISKYLMRDRIDLVSLSSVNKLCRVSALALWVQHMDVPLSKIAKLFRFFAANPNLLSHIRYFRIRDDTGSFYDYENEERRASRELWPEAKCLIAMLGARPPSLKTPLSCDITLRLEDVDIVEEAFSPFSSLTASIVAVKVMLETDSRKARNTSKQRVSGHDQDPLRLAGWVSRIQRTALQHHRSGILSFDWGRQCGVGTFSSATHEQLLLDVWIIITRSLQWSLQELRLKLCKDDAASEILDASEFPNLKVFWVRFASDCTAALDETLERHQQLESVVIRSDSVRDGHVFIAKLPRIRRIWFDHEAQHVGRHFAGCRQVVTEVNWSLYDNFDHHFPKLRSALSLNVSTVLHHVRNGGTLSRIYMDVDGSIEDEEMDSFVPDLYAASATAAAALTCLEVSMTSKSFARSLSVMRIWTAGPYLPNLTELQLSMQFHEEGVNSQANALLKLQTIFSDLLPWRSLRIVRLHTNNIETFSTRRILHGHVFPQRLEYFVWQDAIDEEDVRAFRVLPEPRQTPASVTATTTGGGTPLRQHSGKIGCLERIPSLFRQRVSAEGVWGPHWIDDRVDPVLDHSVFPPTWNLQ